jgi:2-methylcitrate dehydratase
MGFFKQVSGPFVLETDKFGGRKGSFKINETYIKYFPAEYHSQSAIWAALELRKELADPSEIESVEVNSHEAGYTILGKDPEKWKPSTKETADHSLPYIVGMALLEGKIENSTYAPRKFRSKKTLEFLKKITVREDKRLTALYPGEGIANRIKIRTKSERTFEEEVIFPKGHPRNPLSDSEVEQKFRKLTRGFLSEAKRDEALKLLWGLEKVKDVSELAAALLVS